MDTYPQTVNPNLEMISQLQLLCPVTHNGDGQLVQPVDHVQVAAAETAKLGNNPTLLQVANMMMTSLGECKEEAKRVHGVLAQHVGQNTQQIELQSRQLAWIRQHAENSDNAMTGIANRVAELESSVSAVKDKHYKAICETRQRGVKGNFILSGPHVPRPSRDENLFDIAARVMWDKYGIALDWYQLEAMHRLPGGGIILVTSTRMPGAMYEHMVRAVNGNPNRHIQAYLNIQLMEPFDALHYVARKLKANKVISNYRLDENGYSWIAITQDMNSFKFTSVKQLTDLGINIPESLQREVKDYQARKAQQAKEVEERNLARARQPRPNVPQPLLPMGNPESQPPNRNTGGQAQQIHGSRTPQSSQNPPSGASTGGGFSGDQSTIRQTAPSASNAQPVRMAYGSNNGGNVPNPSANISTAPPPATPRYSVPVRLPAPNQSQNYTPGRPPGRSPRSQNSRQFENLRGRFEPRGSSQLLNPYMNDMERKAFNLADEMGLHPGDVVNQWDLGID